MALGPRCDGCLGGQRCWICLGNGLLDVKTGEVKPCHRCFGTGKCSYCQTIKVDDLRTLGQLRR